MVVFFAPQVRDAATGQIVAGLVGQSVTIVYPGTSDPVEITEYPSGTAIPGSVLTVGDTFSLTSFNTPGGVYAVEALASNGARAYLESAQGSRVAAEAAAQAAEDAQSSAGAAQFAAESAQAVAEGLAQGVVRSVNGQTPDGSGNVNVSTGGGTGGAVTSVAGKTGDVTLVVGDVTGLTSALNGKAPTSHSHDGADITAGTIAPARLGSGSTGGTTRFLREDGTWAAPPVGEGGEPPVTSVAGKTGDVALVKGDVGLSNVDNTSDADKPVSSATQSALNAKANDNAVVKLTGNQTVSGVKTFTNFPVVPDGSFTLAKTSGLQAALNQRPTSSTITQIVALTQSEYDSLPSPDASTLYVILEEE